jgi:hypothetical protein
MSDRDEPVILLTFRFADLVCDERVGLAKVDPVLPHHASTGNYEEVPTRSSTNGRVGVSLPKNGPQQLAILFLYSADAKVSAPIVLCEPKQSDKWRGSRMIPKGLSVPTRLDCG